MRKMTAEEEYNLQLRHQAENLENKRSKKIKLDLEPY